MSKDENSLDKDLISYTKRIRTTNYRKYIIVGIFYGDSYTGF